MSAADVPRRQDFLTPLHGVANVGQLLAAHALLVAWFAAGYALLPFGAYLALSLPVCVVHARAMSEWIHEGAHRNLVPSRRANDVLTDALVAIWFGTTTEAYRSTHFPHHARRSFFIDGDPDTDFLDVGSRRALWRALARDLCGLTMVRQFLRFRPGRGGRSAWALAAGALAQGALVAALLAAGRLDAWLVYYAALGVGYPLHNRLRVYGQHVTLEADGTSRFAGSPTSRSIDAGPVDRVLWTSPRLLYHWEHHRWPHLPWRALPGLCERSADRNRYATSRWQVLRAIYRGLPAREGVSGAARGEVA